jgi:hypothetical protein
MPGSFQVSQLSFKLTGDIAASRRKSHRRPPRAEYSAQSRLRRRPQWAINPLEPPAAALLQALVYPQSGEEGKGGRLINARRYSCPALPASQSSCCPSLIPNFSNDESSIARHRSKLFFSGCLDFCPVARELIRMRLEHALYLGQV